jgi:hypothetical protein
VKKNGGSIFHDAIPKWPPRKLSSISVTLTGSYTLHMLHWNMLLLTLEAFKKFDNLICPDMMAQTEAQLQRGQSILKCTNKIALHLADLSRKM